MRRSALKRKRHSIDLETMVAVAQRAEGMCEIRADHRCDGYALHVHHRKLRSQGGSDSLDNLLAVCAPGHRWIHDNPQRSVELDLIVPRDEAERPYEG